MAIGATAPAARLWRFHVALGFPKLSPAHPELGFAKQGRLTDRVEEGPVTLERRKALPATLVVAALGLVVAGCGAVPSSCTPIEYEGAGSPDYVVASDLPLQGRSRTQSLQVNDAIREELRVRQFKAGNFTIGFQACDDSTSQAAKWDARTCSANANNYAENELLVGVIGPLDSSCAAIIIPVLNQAPGGGIPIVSPSNTHPCLTQGGPGCDISEPDKYYPSGRRNYFRVAANDLYQGAAIAEFARARGIKSVYILNDMEAYGVGIATSFRSAARSLEIAIAGFGSWNPEAESYTTLFETVRSSDADAVFIGGLIDQNGAQLIKDKVTVLGPNDGEIELLASDGFATNVTVDGAGAAGAGMYVAAAGVTIDEFSGEAKEFADRFSTEYLSGKATDPYAIYGAQAARVMLDAIAASNGTRIDVTGRLFETNVTEGLLGSFRFNSDGDPAEASGPVVGFTIFEVSDRLEPWTTIYPAGRTIEAATP